jgi:hypothetical protein
MLKKAYPFLRIKKKKKAGPYLYVWRVHLIRSIKFALSHFNANKFRWAYYGRRSRPYISPSIPCRPITLEIHTLARPPPIDRPWFRPPTTSAVGGGFSSGASPELTTPSASLSSMSSRAPLPASPGSSSQVCPLSFDLRHSFSFGWLLMSPHFRLLPLPYLPGVLVDSG